MGIRPRARSHLHSAGPCPAPPTPPSLLGLPMVPAYTCVGTLPHWEPMRQYLIKITKIQVDTTFITPKLFDGVPSHAEEA
jgi:hypothetical protein